MPCKFTFISIPITSHVMSKLNITLHKFLHLVFSFLLEMFLPWGKPGNTWYSSRYFPQICTGDDEYQEFSDEQTRMLLGALKRQPLKELGRVSSRLLASPRDVSLSITLLLGWYELSSSSQSWWFTQWPDSKQGSLSLSINNRPDHGLLAWSLLGSRSFPSL